MTDREKAIRAVETCFDSWIDKHGYEGLDLHKVERVKHDALELLKAQENIVRCKACKYWDDTSEGRYIGGWCFCDRLKFSTSPDWYCADGEEKTDAAD